MNESDNLRRFFTQSMTGTPIPSSDGSSPAGSLTRTHHRNCRTIPNVAEVYRARVRHLAEALADPEAIRRPLTLSAP